jgi:hypothetical protein
MWRAFIVLFVLNGTVLAGSIEMLKCSYDFQAKQIKDLARLTGEWSQENKNRVVFEFQYRSNSTVSFQVFDRDFFYHQLRKRAKTELVPGYDVERLSKPKRSLRLIIDSHDRPFAESNPIFKFQEVTLVDPAKELYEIDHFAVNKNELLAKFSTSKRCLELNSIDKRGDAKMILYESGDTVYYGIFFLKDELTPEPSRPEEKFGTTLAKIKAPFVYAIQYQNAVETQVFERISQGKPFTITVSTGQDEYNHKTRSFKAELFCEIMPQELKNDTLVVALALVARTSMVQKDADPGSRRSTRYLKILQFAHDDVIQVKLPDDLIAPIWRESNGWRVGGEKHDALKLVFDPKINEQTLTIRPVRIE